MNARNQKETAGFWDGKGLAKSRHTNGESGLILLFPEKYINFKHLFNSWDIIKDLMVRTFFLGQ